jgi:DNA-binding transcriptional ArsR family regulator
VTRLIDITDPRLVKAYAHPLRVRILGLLDNRVASPSEIAQELGTPLSNTSYHVRQLAALGLVELVDRATRRGAIEHYYTASFRPKITDEGWAALPGIVRRAVIGGGLGQAVEHIVAAANEGGFDRDDIHFSRTAGRLDEEAWHAIEREMVALLDRIEAIVEASEARLQTDPARAGEEATALMMLFAGPARRTDAFAKPRRPGEARIAGSIERAPERGP